MNTGFTPIATSQVCEYHELPSENTFPAWVLCNSQLGVEHKQQGDAHGRAGLLGPTDKCGPWVIYSRRSGVYTSLRKLPGHGRGCHSTLTYSPRAMPGFPHSNYWASNWVLVPHSWHLESLMVPLYLIIPCSYFFGLRETWMQPQRKQFFPAFSEISPDSFYYWHFTFATLYINISFFLYWSNIGLLPWDDPTCRVICVICVVISLVNLLPSFLASDHFALITGV